MILATEMTKHFEHLAKFVNICSGRGGDEVNKSILFKISYFTSEKIYEKGSLRK